MLPGVELARRRRVHYHGDAPSGPGDHHHHLHGAHSHRAAAAPGPGVAGAALAARIRLEEKLRGAALPSSSPSRWGRLTREGRASASRNHQSRQDQQQQQQQETLATSTDLWSPPPPPASTAALAPPAPAASRARRRAELQRTLSMVDVCAVCLDEVRERHQRVTRLPCSHKYHSECVLPWLAIQPDCPCCRALVPASVEDGDARRVA